MKVIIFDLDDILYPEFEFVRSGFKTVARFLSLRLNINEDDTFNRMLKICEEKERGEIFNILLKELNDYSEEKVKLLLYIYRSHSPQITLHHGVMETMKKLKERNMKLGLLTDGIASVQKNKMYALGLEKIFDLIIYTDDLGEGCNKPSPIPFKVALEFFQTQPKENVYIGDDPTKDFHAPKAMEMMTIKIKKEHQRKYFKIKKTNIVEPEYIVNNIEQILPIIFK